MSVLTEADELVAGERAQAYGPPSVNLGRIADIWSVIMSIRVTPEQVCLCMAGLKIAREIHSHTRDNLVDAAGYLRLIERLADENPPDPVTPAPRVEGFCPANGYHCENRECDSGDCIVTGNRKRRVGL